jgi:hypothetical protein
MIWLVLIYFLPGITKTLMVLVNSDPGMKPMWMLSRQSAPRLFLYFVLYSLAWPFIREPSLWKAFKVFMTGGKALNAYISRLESYGLGPKSKRYPSIIDMNICRLVRQDYADLYRRHRDMARMISVEYKMEHAAELVAMCVLGPTDFANFPSRCNVSWAETIVDAAKNLIENGKGSSYDLRIIETVGAERAWSSEFAEEFDGLLHFT